MLVSAPFQQNLKILLFSLVIIFASFKVINAQDGPCLEVTPQVLKFYVNHCYLEGDNITIGSKGIMISNCGDGDLNWVSTSTAWWVGMEPTQGGNFDSVRVWIDFTDPPDFPIPPAGDTIVLDSKIIVEAPGAINSPQEVLVELYLVCEEEPIHLILNPPHFDINLDENETTTESFEVTELNGREVLVSFGNRSDWLILPVFFAPVYTPATIEFGVSAKGLDEGVYFDTIYVYGGNADIEKIEFIPVTLTVGNPQFRLNSIPDRFDFKYSDMLHHPSGSLYVFEESGASIDFWTYNNSDWLYIDSIGVSRLKTPAVIPVYIAGDTLGPGYHYDTIFVDGVGVVEPHAVPVTLTLGMEDYVVATAPRWINDRIEPGYHLYQVHVYELYGREIPFVVSNSQPWLQVSGDYPPPPYTTGERIPFYIDAALLEPGVYRDTIFITPPPDDDSYRFEPVTVSVAIIVMPYQPVVMTNPADFNLQASAGDPAMFLPLHVYEINGANIPFHWSTAGNSEWLQVPMIEILLMTPNTIEIVVSTDSLAPGLYHDTAIIYYPYDDIYGFDDVYIPVQLEITDNPQNNTVLTEPTAFIWSADKDTVIQDNLEVYEVSGHQVPFVYSNKQPWLAVNPLGLLPELTPQTILVVANTSGLEFGVYLDTILIMPTSRSQFFTPRAVPVILGVGSVFNGDANRDNAINISDAVYLINYIFHQGPRPEPMEAGDSNADGAVNVGDVVHLLEMVFRGGSMPSLGN
jgi:hypothetical protein